MKMNKLTVFEKKVLRMVTKIPKGKVTTYQLLAKAVGRSRAFRAVANALAKNPQLTKIPCHRVIKSNGKIGGYRLGIKKKLSLLKKEGIKFQANKKIKNLSNIIQIYE